MSIFANTKHTFGKWAVFAMLVLPLGGCQEDTIEPTVYGTLKGQVLLDGAGTPVPDAIISTSPPSTQVLTDAQGRFTLENIEEGTYTVRAELSGLKTAVESVSVKEEETTTVILTMAEEEEDNRSPTAPQRLAPANGATDLETSITLSWTATDPDNDPLSFDVYTFHTLQGPSQLVADDISDTTFQLDNLPYGATFFWQVVVSDGQADPVYGEVWAFSTKPFPEHPFAFAKLVGGKYDVFGGQLGGASQPIHQLSTLAGSSFRPRISPLGDKVAFLNNNFINTQLYVMNRDGSDPQLVPTPVPVDGEDMRQLDFSWSPDGTKLLFMNENRLYWVNVNGSGFSLFAELPVGEEFVEVDWAPVTNKIAARTVGDQPYTGRILLYSAGGSLEQELVPDLPGNIGGPAFSIDGSSILYTHDVDGLETSDGRQLNAHIFLKNIATGVVTDLSGTKPLGYNDLDPKFAPNGASIIFVETSNVPSSVRNIKVTNATGTTRLALFDDAEMPDWH